MDVRTRTVPQQFALLLLEILLGVLVTPSAFAFQSRSTVVTAPASAGCESNLTNRPHILPEDLAVFEKVATKENVEFVVMAPNPASLRFRSLPGYASKPAELKNCKSATSGAVEGLVQCPEKAFKSRAEWERNKAYLLSLGYEVLGPDQSYLVRRIADGKYFFSDYDLFSVRNAANRSAAYSEPLRYELNSLMGRNLVRHGPLADYAQRLSVPIKLPLLVVTPGRSTVVIETRAQLEREFARRGLPYW